MVAEIMSSLGAALTLVAGVTELPRCLLQHVAEVIA